MKAYLVTTGAIFGLITVAHLRRIIDEWPHLLSGWATFARTLPWARGA